MGIISSLKNLFSNAANQKLQLHPTDFDELVVKFGMNRVAEEDLKIIMRHFEGQELFRLPNDKPLVIFDVEGTLLQHGKEPLQPIDKIINQLKKIDFEKANVVICSTSPVHFNLLKQHLGDDTLSKIVCGVEFDKNYLAASLLASYKDNPAMLKTIIYVDDNPDKIIESSVRKGNAHNLIKIEGNLADAMQIENRLDIYKIKLPNEKYNVVDITKLQSGSSEADYKPKNKDTIFVSAKLLFTHENKAGRLVMSLNSELVKFLDEQKNLRDIDICVISDSNSPKDRWYDIRNYPIKNNLENSLELNKMLEGFGFSGLGKLKNFAYENKGLAIYSTSYEKREFPAHVKMAEASHEIFDEQLKLNTDNFKNLISEHFGPTTNPTLGGVPKSVNLSPDKPMAIGL